MRLPIPIRMDASPAQIAAMAEFFDRAEEIDEVGHGSAFMVIAHINLQRDVRDNSRCATISAAWLDGETSRRVKSIVTGEIARRSAPTPGNATTKEDETT